MMNETLDHFDWATYFNEFTRRNKARPTRLEVFGDAGAQEEERGLFFTGITIEERGDTPRVQIMLADVIASRHLTHVVSNVRQITPKLGLDGRDEALEIISAEGSTSLLRFEPQAMLAN
jgi:Family of unknown function (DUF5335)